MIYHEGRWSDYPLGVINTVETSESVLYSLRVRVDIYTVSFRPHSKQCLGKYRYLNGRNSTFLANLSPCEVLKISSIIIA